MNKHEDSMECCKYELSIFDVQPTQTSVLSGKWNNAPPTQGYVDNAILEFNIKGDTSHYIDLGQTELYIKVKVASVDPTKTVNNMVLDDKYIYPINNFVMSMFSDATVKFNNTVVEKTNDMLPYKAYTETLLNYDSESKKTFILPQCFAKDTAGSFDTLIKKEITRRSPIMFEFPAKNPYGVSPADFAYPSGVTEDDAKKTARTFAFGAREAVKINEGAHARRQFLIDNGCLVCRLPLDTFNMNHYLLNGVDVLLTLKKASTSFCLMYDSDDSNLFKIVFSEPFLRVRRCVISADTMLRHSMGLEKEMAKYEYTKVLVKPVSLEYKATSQTITSIHQGIMPKRVVFGFTTTKAYSGHPKLNPFNFSNFGLESVQLKISTNSVVFEDALKMKTIDLNYDYVQGYRTLFTNLREASNDISFYDYKNGYFLFAYNMSPDLCSDGHKNLFRDGSLDLHLKFDQKGPGDEPLVLIMYLEFDARLYIDRDRKVSCDFE
jgi:hypothetical protein